jgi:hypothetical protein
MERMFDSILSSFYTLCPHDDLDALRLIPIEPKFGLAAAYKQREESGVLVHYLDDFIDRIGFNHTVFRIDQNMIDPHSIVIVDALSGADGIEEFRSRLRFPTYSYITGNSR